jgi:hypothetical protein
MIGSGRREIRARDEGRANSSSRQQHFATLRTAEPSDAPRLHAPIATHLKERHLLPGTLGALAAHASRFVVAARGKSIVGCAELPPLSHTDCVTCPLFRRCGQFAMVVPLDPARDRAIAAAGGRASHARVAAPCA